MHELAERLREAGVSQRHTQDTAGWRLIAEALADAACPAVVRAALEGGAVDASDVVTALADATWPSGTPMFPFLAGPKVGPMVVRMLVFPGDAPLTGLDRIPVAVDTHVQRASEMLGLVPPRELNDAHREAIQRAWFEAVRVGGFYGGPPEIDGTAAGLDPALWTLGRDGCAPCEQAKRKKPRGPVCAFCKLGRVVQG